MEVPALKVVAFHCIRPDHCHILLVTAPCIPHQRSLQTLVTGPKRHVNVVVVQIAHKPLRPHEPCTRVMYQSVFLIRIESNDECCSTGISDTD